MFIAIATAVWSSPAHAAPGGVVHPGVNLGVGLIPCASLSVSADRLHLVGEAGVGWLPLVSSTQYVRAGATWVVSRRDVDTFRVQPMVGVRRVDPGLFPELANLAIRLPGALDPTYEPQLLATDAANYLTLTATGEYTRPLSTDVGLTARATVGFGAGEVDRPELGLSAGLSF